MGQSQYDNSSISLWNRKVIPGFSVCCQVPLRFASRLLQEAHANLKVLHIFDSKHADLNASALNPVEVALQLPLETWRKAGLYAPQRSRFAKAIRQKRL